MTDPIRPGVFRGLITVCAAALLALGSLASASAQLCLPGTFSPTGSVPCAGCPAGHYQPDAGQTSCLSCGAGSFSVGGAATCSLCGPGEFQDLPAQTTCKDCGAGSASAGNGATSCALCAPGEFQNLPGQTSCIDCDPGFFSNINGATICSQCGLGEFQDDPGTTACQDCSPGSFTNMPGQSACTSCGLGQFQADAGATTCHSCNPGSFTNTLGAGTCASCGLGQFQGDAGATTCHSCNPGSFTNAPGASTCMSCGLGQFQDDAGATTCDSCGAGSFSNTIGASTCSSCTPGEYQPAPGTTACIGCGPGTFSATPGASACLTCSTCPPGTVEEEICTETGDVVCTSPCGAAPDPMCLVAAQAQLQSNEKTLGKEQLKLQWKKVTTPTTRATFGDPINGTTSVTLCLFDDAGTLVEDLAIARAGQTCGTKPCWKLKGKQGFGFQDKPGASDGINKLSFGGGVATKGQASAQGKNDPKKGFTNLPAGIVAALTGKTAPTIEIRTSDGLCIGAKMNKVTKDKGGQYKAQKK